MAQLEIKKENGKIYSFIRDKWLIRTPEEEVRQNFVCVLVNEFGYSINQMGEELKVNNSQRGQGKARADIVVWKSEQDKSDGKTAFIVVECKAENVKIHKEDYYQGFNYASWAGASFFVTTNNRETKYFNVDKDYLPKNLEEIVTIPKAEEVNNDNRIKEILSQTKTFTREEFTRLLLRCHNIIRNNDKLSPEAAFDEISKILFIKIDFERRFKGVQVFTKDEYDKQKQNYETFTRPTLKKQGIDKAYMQVLFDNTKIAYENDHLFEENESIKIRETSFTSILEELQKYNLSDTSDDVKGIAFEQFLGRTFRGELGQFFTPRTIVDFMTEILDPQEGELICDPCCGSGGFLIKVFDYIKEKIEQDIQAQKEKFKNAIASEYPEEMTEKEQLELNERIEKVFSILNNELEHTHNDSDITSPYSRLDNLSYKSIYGTDANPRMARTSKMNMIMHGDGHGGVHHHDGLINVNGIFENHFDVILTNPPFGQTVGKDQNIELDDIDNNQERIKLYSSLYGEEYLRQLKDLKRRAEGKKEDGSLSDKEKSLLNLYETGKMTGLTEVLFIERCLRLLKPGGRMGIVLPEGVLNNSNLQKVRDYFEGKAKLILICSIPQDVFIKAGATVKPSLVFMKKFTLEEQAQYDKCVQEAKKIVYNKYAGEIELLESDLATKTITKKDYTAKLKVIEAKKEAEIKPIIKEKFDYEIPIAKVEKAGITTTGAECENELDYVLEEFRKYNEKNTIWTVTKRNWAYALEANGTINKVTIIDTADWGK